MGTIAGIVTLDGRPVERAALERMGSAVVRQLDAPPTFHVEGNAGFLHGAYSTTPEEANDPQPLTIPERGVTFVFWGRLDNRSELFALLPESERPSADAPDSQLALAAYLRLGEEAPPRLFGDFVFAAWHTRERRLFCTRSPGGWRPFYWCRTEKEFAFGTEPEQLFAGSSLPRRPNEGCLGEILARRPSSLTETLWDGMYRLAQGWSLTLASGEVREKRWYSPQPTVAPHRSDGEWVEQFRTLFDEALTSCLRSRTEVAAHVSGGLDSSSVVSRIVQLHRAGRASRSVRPVSVVYPGIATDESEWINAVTSHTGVEGERVRWQRYDWDAMREWTARTGYLPVRPNAFSLATLNATLQDQGIRVLLTGEGGDDWFAGSRAHWPDLLRAGRIRELLKEAAPVVAGGTPAMRTIRALTHSLAPLVSKRRRLQLAHPEFTEPMVPWYIRPEWAQRIGLEERLRAPIMERIPGGIRRERAEVLLRGCRHYMGYENFSAWTGGAGIELRHPFHDRRLIEFSLSAPGNLFLRGTTKKWVLREAMSDTLPPTIRDRASKARFDNVIAEVLTEELERRPVSSLECVRRGWVDGDLLLQSFEKYQAAVRTGTKPDDVTATPMSLWFAASVDMWLRHAAGV